jgi:hypothetical protein
LQRRLGVLGDCGDEVLRARARGLDVLGALLEDVLEVDGDIGQLALEQVDDVLVVLALLVAVWPAVLLRERGEVANLLVERGQVLLDDECELVDLDWPIVEQRAASRDW